MNSKIDTDLAAAKRILAHRGFSLVEIVVVILILGILSSVAAPKLINTSAVASQNAFITQMFAYADGFDLYKVENGSYPSSSPAGTLPSGMEKYLNPDEFALKTPLGGNWDYELGVNSVMIGIVYINGNNVPSTDRLVAIDQMIDDGNLATGSLFFIDGTKKWLFWKFGDK